MELLSIDPIAANIEASPDFTAGVYWISDVCPLHGETCLKLIGSNN